MKVVDVEGIGPGYAGKLQEAGIRTTAALLRAGASPRGRTDVAARTGISEKLILEWVNHADLMRVRGIGPEYADLLEAAGVDTVKELAQRRSDNLLTRLLEVNGQKKLVRRPPTASMVDGWVASAKALPGVLTY